MRPDLKTPSPTRKKVLVAGGIQRAGSSILSVTSSNEILRGRIDDNRSWSSVSVISMIFPTIRFRRSAWTAASTSSSTLQPPSCYSSPKAHLNVLWSYWSTSPGINQHLRRMRLCSPHRLHSRSDDILTSCPREEMQGLRSDRATRNSAAVEETRNLVITKFLLGFRRLANLRNRNSLKWKPRRLVRFDSLPCFRFLVRSLYELGLGIGRQEV